MTLKSKLLLISRGREDSRAHRLALAIVEYAWDRGAEVRVRRDAGSRAHAWAGTQSPDDKLPEVTGDDLEWADVTIVLGDRAQARGFGEDARARGPRLVS